MSFSKYYVFREMVHFSLPHTVNVDGDKMPCPGKIKVSMIDMRFEDYGQQKNFPMGKPFIAKLPGADYYVVYHGSYADLLNSSQAEQYINQYPHVPDDWWKYAEAMDDKDERTKQAFVLRGDWEKADPNKACQF